VTKGYLVRVGEFWVQVEAEADDTFHVRVDTRTLAADRRTFDEALAYYRHAYTTGAEFDQLFAAKPGVVVTALRSFADENLLELELVRGPADDRDR
jgi:hypothetical protein